jgi:hypothetical protein
MDSKALTSLLYKESGLLGVSGISQDMRVLLESTAPEAREAVDLFCYRIVREIGSLAAALGGLDALVFTGGIGEHGAPVRERSAPARLARIDPRCRPPTTQTPQNFATGQPDRGLRHTHERRVDYCAAHSETHRLSRHFRLLPVLSGTCQPPHLPPRKSPSNKRPSQGSDQVLKSSAIPLFFFPFSPMQNILYLVGRTRHPH